MSNSDRTKRTIPRLIASIALGMLGIAWRSALLGLLIACSELAPYVRPLLWRLAVLGALLSLIFEFVIQAPEFPFWSAMQLSIVCTVLLLLHNAVSGACKTG